MRAAIVPFFVPFFVPLSAALVAQSRRAGRALALIAVLCAWLVGTAAPQRAAAQSDGLGRLETAPVTVITADGAAHVFLAELAMTYAARERGLMFRERLGRENAMLFVYPAPQRVAFWMRNTLIPLDIVFADADGVVVNVAAEARPGDETPLPSAAPAQFVLEIEGGLAAELGIGPGARLASPAMLDARRRAE